VVVVPAEVLEVVLPDVLVVAPDAVVVVVLGAVVVVVPLAVVVEVIGGAVVAVVVSVVALSAFKTAVTTFPFGRTIVVPLGANETVISSVGCVKRMVRKSPVCFVPVFAVAVDHTSAASTPVLPESGVPEGHCAPSLNRCPFGREIELAVSLNPAYWDANLPRVALAPASAELFGWICSTPEPDEYKPAVRLCSTGLAFNVC
jgi:hypothetical protein